jgi:hypothetical protein
MGQEVSEMNAEQIRAAVAADPALMGLIPDVQAIAAAMSPVVTLREVFVTERGIVNALGIIEGEAFLQAVEGFAAADLPDEHPLKPYQPGIARQIAWLKRDGIDVGSALVRSLLDTMAQIKLLAAPSVAAVKALAEVSTTITPEQVRSAIYDAGGINA